MDFAERSVHPLGGFDLLAIGVALVVVMTVLGMRRLARLWAGARLPSDDENEGQAGLGIGNMHKHEQDD